jgi:hypothetical protein
MGAFDNLGSKAAEFAAENSDQVEGVSDQVVEKVGDVVDGATGDKFSDQIDSAQEQADGFVGE